MDTLPIKGFKNPFIVIFIAFSLLIGAKKTIKKRTKKYA